MPATNPVLATPAADRLRAVGEAIRVRRKSLRISAVVAAEAAGISRVTLHRVEKGEPAVTMGAYAAVAAALDLDIRLLPLDAPTGEVADRKGWIPVRVRLADYPRLKELAWQVHGTPELTPREALDIYERNHRHLDPATLSDEERDLLEALRQGLAGEGSV